ncbi:hypothetical protein Bca4012_074067 [Brassica carinata]
MVRLTGPLASGGVSAGRAATLLDVEATTSNSLDGDDFYASFLNIWESDLENSIGGGGPLKLEQKTQEHVQDHQEKKTEACSSRLSRDCDTMEKKIKEMYVIETGDIEQALDIPIIEALKEQSDRPLDTVEKLKKRSKLFKLQMPTEKDTAGVKNMVLETLSSAKIEGFADGFRGETKAASTEKMVDK